MCPDPSNPLPTRASIDFSLRITSRSASTTLFPLPSRRHGNTGSGYGSHQHQNPLWSRFQARHPWWWHCWALDESPEACVLSRSRGIKDRDTWERDICSHLLSHGHSLSSCCLDSPGIRRFFSQSVATSPRSFHQPQHQHHEGACHLPGSPLRTCSGLERRHCGRSA